MQRSGIAHLPLHGGRAPPWLTGRMRKLSRQICSLLIDEYGVDVFLNRVSDPYWFQALGCVLGYDWHSSGVTTVVTGVLKQALSAEEHGIAVCGGKGKTSKKTPIEIIETADIFGLSEKKTQELVYTSKITAKIDNSAIQAGYQLYHHSFLVTEDAKWAVIQQGMSPSDKSARRYHWLSDNTENFVIEPHNAIVGEIRRPLALNMTSKMSHESRKVSVDLSKEPTKKLINIAQKMTPPKDRKQKTLQQYFSGVKKDTIIQNLDMPRNINWKALAKAYEIKPTNYEELLNIRGVGPATVRGLALIAELVYGAKNCWEDPVKYSFAYGGKDGVPFPVNRNSMDQSIEILKQIVQEARIGNKDKTKALQRLRIFVPPNTKSS